MCPYDLSSTHIFRPLNQRLLTRLLKRCHGNGNLLAPRVALFDDDVLWKASVQCAFAVRLFLLLGNPARMSLPATAVGREEGFDEYECVILNSLEKLTRDIRDQSDKVLIWLR